MMRNRNGLVAEEGFHELLARVHDHVDELMAAYAVETHHGVRCWLLELIGEAQSERALELLCAETRSTDEALRDWAIRGLRLLNTHASRKFLYESGIPK